MSGPSERIEITPEMLKAGELELAVRCDPSALIASLNQSDLRALYIAHEAVRAGKFIANLSLGILGAASAQTE